MEDNGTEEDAVSVGRRCVCERAPGLSFEQVLAALLLWLKCVCLPALLFPLRFPALPTLLEAYLRRSGREADSGCISTRG